MNRIKDLRKEKGISQFELSKIFKVTEKTISRWENEEVQIKPEKAQRLADYFDVSISYLLGYSEINSNILTGVGQAYFGKDLDILERDRQEFTKELLKDIDVYQSLYSELGEYNLKGSIIKMVNFFDSKSIYHDEILDIYRYAYGKFELLLFRSLAELQTIQEGSLLNEISNNHSENE